MPQSSQKGTEIHLRAIELIREAAKAVESADGPINKSELAERSGIPRTTLQKLLVGNDLPNLYVHQLVMIAESLGVDAATWIATIERERRGATVTELRPRQNEKPTRSARAVAKRRNKRGEDAPDS